LSSSDQHAYYNALTEIAWQQLLTQVPQFL
jgi:hypothetical protein